MSALLRVEPPTDPQLAMIRRLCAEQGWTPPGAVYSKAEASEIIGGMLAATYDDADFGEHAFANGCSMYAVRAALDTPPKASADEPA